MSQPSPSHIRATAVRVATLRRLALSVLFTITTTSYQTTCTVSERTFNKRQHANARYRVESLTLHALRQYSSSGNPGSAGGAVQGDDKLNEFSYLFRYTNSPKTALSEPVPQEVQWILSSCEKWPFTAKVIHMRQTLFYILNITLTGIHFKYYKHYYMQWCLRPIMFSFSFSFSGKNEQNNSLVLPRVGAPRNLGFATD